MIEQASAKNNWHYNPKLQKFANENRKNLTKSAACMWKYVLKGKMMHGYSFKRERPILFFIADFVCLELMLVIEVDGITHGKADQMARDLKRDTELKSVGFTVLRFSSENVLSNIELVQIDISNHIKWKLGDKNSLEEY